MFGTLKPRPCALGGDAKREYAAHYCGLCKSLGDSYGTIYRGALSHDSVFLSLLAGGLLDEAPEPSSCRCPLLPVVHRPTVSPGGVAMRYAAGMQMLLAEQLVADRAMEGKAAYRAARSLLDRPVRRARGMLAELGVDLDALRGFEREQAGVEVAGETGPLEAAEPTARALGVVFVELVQLPGAGARLRSAASRRALRALGEAVGRTIYLIDALEDLRRDLRRGEFNPCLVRGDGGALRASRARVERCVAELRADREAMRARLAELPFRRHRGLLVNILCVELGERARAAARDARAVASPPAPREAAGLSARVHDGMLWLLAFLVTFAASLPDAFAQKLGGKRPPAPRGPPLHPAPADAGLPDGACDDGGAGAPADAGRPPGMERCDAGPDSGGGGGGLGAGAGGHGHDGGAPWGEPLDGGDADAGPGHGSSHGGPCSVLHDLLASVAACCHLPAQCASACTGCCESSEKSCCNPSCTSCSPARQCCDCEPCCKACSPDSCCKGCDARCCNCGDSCNGCNCGGCGGCGNCGGCCGASGPPPFDCGDVGRCDGAC